jgi:hypothetical protein
MIIHAVSERVAFDIRVSHQSRISLDSRSQSTFPDMCDVEWCISRDVFLSEVAKIGRFRGRRSQKIKKHRSQVIFINCPGRAVGQKMA